MEIEITIPKSSHLQIQDLEERLSQLSLRENQIQKALKKAEENKSFVAQSNKNNFLMKEKILDFIYENQVMEKYTRSENFKSLDEAIVGYLICEQEFLLENQKLSQIINSLESEEE